MTKNWIFGVNKYYTPSDHNLFSYPPLVLLNLVFFYYKQLWEYHSGYFFGRSPNGHMILSPNMKGQHYYVTRNVKIMKGAAQQNGGIDSMRKRGFIRVHLHWIEIESKSDIASRWVHRESNLMLTLSSDKDQRKIRLTLTRPQSCHSIERPPLFYGHISRLILPCFCSVSHKQ